MIKSKKNIQKLYIELKTTRKKAGKYFKQLNKYYPTPKTITVLKAILEGVDKINSSTKESNVKLENIINQYIETDHDFRGLNFATVSNSAVSLMSAKHYGSEEQKEFTMRALSYRIKQAKELIEYSDSDENVKDFLIAIK
jgi:hypothetical protein|nr:MAG TPA: hypothetical protein [Caudoviricetes sp.]